MGRSTVHKFTVKASDLWEKAECKGRPIAFEITCTVNPVVHTKPLTKERAETPGDAGKRFTEEKQVISITGMQARQKLRYWACRNAHLVGKGYTFTSDEDRKKKAIAFLKKLTSAQLERYMVSCRNQNRCHMKFVVRDSKTYTLREGKHQGQKK